MNTYTSFCIAGCVFMCFVGMAGMFVNTMGIFSTAPGTGMHGDEIGIFGNLTQNVTSEESNHLSFDSIWAVGTGAAIIGAIAISILTGSTAMIGIWIFGSVFWSGWINLLYLFNYNNFLTEGAGAVLVAMVTIGMMFMFAGAVIGMLSGSTTMR